MAGDVLPVGFELAGDRLRLDAIGVAEPAGPFEDTGLGLEEFPAAIVFEPVTVSAFRAQVLRRGGSILGEVAGVVQIGGPGEDRATGPSTAAVSRPDELAP